MLTSSGRYWLCFFARTKSLCCPSKPLQPIQIPRAPGGGGGRGGAACVPSSTNNSNNIIGSICSITEIFSREMFFSVYISADSDVNTDLVISEAWEPTCASEGLASESKHR